MTTSATMLDAHPRLPEIDTQLHADTLDALWDAARVASLPRSFIDCTSPALATIAVMRQRVRSEPGWRVHELATVDMLPGLPDYTTVFVRATNPALAPSTSPLARGAPRGAPSKEWQETLVHVGEQRARPGDTWRGKARQGKERTCNGVWGCGPRAHRRAAGVFGCRAI